MSFTSFQYAFKGKSARLCSQLDVSHGLLECLLDRDVITRQQAADCRSTGTEYDMAAKLLDILERKDDSLYPLFCEALLASQQAHIIAILQEQPNQTSRTQSYSSGAQAQFQAAPRAAVNNTPAPAAASYHQPSSIVPAGGQGSFHQTSVPPVRANAGASAPASATLAPQSQSSNNQLFVDVVTVPHSELSDVVKIAEGGFGTIYKAKHARFGDVAYKELKATIISPNDKVGRELRREAQSHVLRHPNIVPMWALVFEPGHYGVLLQFAQHGGLDKFIENNEVKFLTKMSIAHNIILGMNYLHTRNPPTIHGDLKVQNVLVSDGFVAQICDFGLTKWRAFSTTKTAGRSQRGTVTHIPPESWSNINLRRTTTFDIYGFGVLLWELLSEKVPFCQDNGGIPNTEQIKSAVMSGQRPLIESIELEVDDAWKKVATDFIVSCWEQIPERRPPFAELNDKFEHFLKPNERAVEREKQELAEKVLQVHPSQ